MALLVLYSYENDIKQSGIIFEHLVYVHHVTIATAKTFNVVKLILLTNADEILLGKMLMKWDEIENKFVYSVVYFTVRRLLSLCPKFSTSNWLLHLKVFLMNLQKILMKSI